MNNPYAPPPLQQSFQVREAVQSTTTFAITGVVCGSIGGGVLQLIISNRITYSTMLQLLFPGLILGLGLYYATKKSVPHARRWGLNLFPIIGLLACGIIGVAYDLVLQRVIVTNIPNNFYHWLWFCAVSIPGVSILALGCLLVARPKSYFRFAMFILLLLCFCGVAPMITEMFPGVTGPVPVYLATMFIAQVLIFTMLGGIFGDSIGSDDKAGGQQE